ncbi:MAG: L-seryl-tRNA(Sec) selenium transferase [Chloroflexi bacterium]|nr:L-seryl-tRNA(Sec) selenium transferase [Chloroflexota bacterium]
MTNPFRQLPSIDRLLARPELVETIAMYGRAGVRDIARDLLGETRVAIRKGATPPEIDELITQLLARIRREFSPSLRSALNATGVIIHTNLGRAPLSLAAREAMMAAAAGYGNLEYDLEQGRRGSRYVHAERLLCRLTGAEAALVVNNNAAAVTLVLRHLARGREVIISRGELVEIGGGFRIPDILQQSGARLVEVGTTNRTRLADYAIALGSDTAAILKVHQSNFRIVGFSESASLAELVRLVNDWVWPVPVINDLGSGTLLDTRPFGLAYEPTVQDSVQAGANITTFSGDKLLGGPQAGVIVGDKAIIEALKLEPLTRAMRVDKITLAALQATLMAYARETAVEEIPVWRMIAAQPEALAHRAESWADALVAAGLPVELRPGQSAIGGGALPGQTLPTTLLAVLSDKPQSLAARLRANDPPVVARIEEDAVVFDPRTISPDEEPGLLRAIQDAWAQ